MRLESRAGAVVICVQPICGNFYFFMTSRIACSDNLRYDLVSSALVAIFIALGASLMRLIP